MDLVGALQITLRRWKIAVSVLVIAIVGAVAAYLGAGTVYSARNYVVVVPSSVSSAPGAQDTTSAAISPNDQAQRNALVNAGGARLISNLLVTNLNSAAVRARFGDGTAATYTASADPQLPVVTVTVNGSDEAAVSALLGRTIDGSDGVLANLQTQAGIPPSTSYRAPRFAPDPVVTAASPNRTRAVVAIVAAGVALSVVLSVALDGLLSRRTARRRAVARAADEPEAGGVVSVDPVPAAEATTDTSAADAGSVTVPVPVDPFAGDPDTDPKRTRTFARPNPSR